MRKINDLFALNESIRKFSNFDFQKVDVKEIIFFESVSTPEGPVYKTLSVHPLKNT